jgi:hypothetical protein
MRDLMSHHKAPLDPTNPEPAPKRAKADSGEQAVAEEPSSTTLTPVTPVSSIVNRAG